MKVTWDDYSQSMEIDLGGLFMRHVAEHDAQFLRSGSGSGDIW